MLSHDFATCFGFTEDDVRWIAEQAGAPKMAEEIRPELREGELHVDLAIPNEEIRQVFKTRYDVAIAPLHRSEPGVVLEQIEERRYVAELETAGADPIHTYAVVFDGKRVWERQGNGVDGKEYGEG